MNALRVVLETVVFIAHPGRTRNPAKIGRVVQRHLFQVAQHQCLALQVPQVLMYEPPGE